MEPAIAELRATVVIDYQNVHLTGHDLFESDGPLRRHETLVDPLHFVGQVIGVRNQRQKPGMAHASLCRVLVYRGEPSPLHDPIPYARNQSQKSRWERDSRVQVYLRPLKYDYEREASGRKVSGPDGRWIVKGAPREKGVAERHAAPEQVQTHVLVREVVGDLLNLAGRHAPLTYWAWRDGSAHLRRSSVKVPMTHAAHGAMMGPGGDHDEHACCRRCARVRRRA